MSDEPCITDWLCLPDAHLLFGECVYEPDPFAPGTRVEVHEVPGGYIVFRAEGD